MNGTHEDRIRDLERRVTYLEGYAKSLRELIEKIDILLYVNTKRAEASDGQKEA